MSDKKEKRQGAPSSPSYHLSLITYHFPVYQQTATRVARRAHFGRARRVAINFAICT
jgi:hypothetical protein